MKRKKEIEYLNHHWKKMQRSFKSYMENHDPEQLRQLRVGVKRLKAMLVLMEHTLHTKQLLKRFKPVREIFKNAGEIREAQLQLDFAEQYQLIDAAVKLEDQNKLAEATKRFDLNAPHYLKVLKRSRRRIKNRMRAIPDKSVIKFYKSELKSISGGLNTPHFDESLHDNRKQLKVLMYNYDLAGNKLESKLNFNETYVEDLQGKIGDWHDQSLLLALLDAPEVHQRAASAKIKRDNRKLEKEIIKAVQDFMIKVKKQPADKVAE